MKTFFILFLFVSFTIFTACQGGSENTEETDDTAEATDKSTNSSQEKEETQEDLFFELSFENGSLEGKTLGSSTKAKSPAIQAYVNEGEPIDLSFTKAEVASGELTTTFSLGWKEGLNEGEVDMERAEVKIINTKKDSKYDFGRLKITAEEVKHKITKVEEWESNVGQKYAFVEGEGEISKSKVDNTISEMERKAMPSVIVKFKYRAKVQIDN